MRERLAPAARIIANKVPAREVYRDANECYRDHIIIQLDGAGLLHVLLKVIDDCEKVILDPRPTGFGAVIAA
jgi:hypothetical protein